MYELDLATQKLALMHYRVRHGGEVAPAELLDLLTLMHAALKQLDQQDDGMTLTREPPRPPEDCH
jgi:hypothetical protein